MDNDNKIKLESKKGIKERLGRSPDYMDAISFRMWWLIKEHGEWTVPEEDRQTKSIEEVNQEELLKFLMEDDDKEDDVMDFDIY